MSYEPPPDADDQPYLVHLRPATEMEEPLHRRKRLILPAAAAIAVIGIAAAGFLHLGGDDDPKQLTGAVPAPYRSTTVPASAEASAPSTAASTARPSSSPTVSPSSAPPSSTAPSSTSSSSTAARTTAPPTTATPRVTASSAPTATAVATIDLRGRGTRVVPFARTISDTMLMTTTKNGDGAITVHALTKDGTGDDLLVDAVGSYRGQVLFNTGGKDMAGLRIQGSGSWTVTLAAPSTAKAWTGKGTYRGTGDSVLRAQGVFGARDAMTFVSRKARSTVTVRAYAADGDDELVVDDLGNFSGEYLMPNGTVYVVVRSDGAWTIRRS